MKGDHCEGTCLFCRVVRPVGSLLANRLSGFDLRAFHMAALFAIPIGRSLHRRAFRIGEKRAVLACASVRIPELKRTQEGLPGAA